MVFLDHRERIRGLRDGIGRLQAVRWRQAAQWTARAAPAIRDWLSRLLSRSPAEGFRTLPTPLPQDRIFAATDPRSARIDRPQLPDLEHMLRQAEQARRSGDILRHIRILRDALQNHPATFASLQAVVASALSGSRPSLARRVIRKHAPDLTPSEHRVLQSLVLQAEAGTVQALEHLLRHAPQGDENCLREIYVARYTYELEGVEAALATLEAAASLTPRKALFESMIRFAREAHLPPDRRLRMAQAAMAAGFHDAAFHVVAHTAFSEMGAHREALKIIDTGLKHNPRSYRLLRYAVASAFRLDDLELVETLLKKARAAIPLESGQNYNELIEVYTVAKRHAEACLLGRAGVEAYPKSSAAIQGFLKAHENFGDVRTIQAYMPRLVEVAPRNTILWRTARRIQNFEHHALPVPRSDQELYEILFPELLSLTRGTPSSCGDAIVLVTSSLAVGGAERQCVAVARELVRQQQPAEILCLRRRLYAGSLEEEVIRSKIPLSLLEDEVIPGEAEDGMLPAKLVDFLDLLPRQVGKEVRDLTAYFMRVRPRVVHGWQDTGATAALAALLAGVPTIIMGGRRTMQPAWYPRHQKVRDLFRLVLHWPQVRLICNSAMGARSFETWLGMEAGSANVVMNGYDFDLIDRQAGTRSPVTLRSELGWTSSHVVVGLAARMHPVKRWHVWLRVLKTVSDRNPQVRGLCVGDGPLMDEMKALARDLDLEGKVQFVGRKVPVEPWIGAMDILMMTSESEGLPNTLIEAQALGVPVISNDAGGAAETILEGETGHLVRCNHLPEHEIAERLAEPLYRLASDHALRRHMAGQARSFARSRFSIAQAAKVYLAYYASVGAAGKALPPSDP